MKNFVLGLMIAVCGLGSVYAGECANSCCATRLPRRVVTLSTEVVNVPVEVTTRTVNRVRRMGRRVSCGCSCGSAKAETTVNQPTLAEPAPAK